MKTPIGFTEWTKADLHRFYVSKGPLARTKTYIALSGSGQLWVSSPTAPDAFKIVLSALDEMQFPRHLEYTSMDHLRSTLKEFGLMSPPRKSATKAQGSAMPYSSTSGSSKTFGYFATERELVANCDSLEPSKAPFRVSSIKDLVVLVQPQEYAHLGEFFEECPLPVEKDSSIPCDLLIRSVSTGSELLIERKTIPDFRQSIISSHAHDQAERMWSYGQQKIKEGVRVMTCWIAEAGEEAVNPYSSLPQVKQMDGMVNYLCAILGQHLMQSFGKKHTVYLTLKLAQGFFEQQLYYPIKSDNGKKANYACNMKRKERLERTSQAPSASGSTQDHGVARLNDAGQALAFLPGMNTAAAAALSNAGLSIADVCALGVAELQGFPGIGPKTAQALYDILHGVSGNSSDQIDVS